MAAETMYVTVAGAGDKSGDTWAKAMDLAAWSTDSLNNSEADDIYYVMEGTYTLTGGFDCNGRTGSAVAPISVIGVKSGTSNEPPILTDWAAGDARPLIAAGGNIFRSGTYWKLFNLRETATGSFGIMPYTKSIGYNLKSSGSCVSAIWNTGTVIDSEATTTNVAGVGFRSAGDAASYVFCYAHDVVTGFFLFSKYHLVAFCIADTCSGKGIDVLATYENRLLNNTIYNCGVGIDGTTGYSNSIINNIINDCTVGGNWTTQTDSNLWLNNNFEGNGTKLVNVAIALPHSDWLETNFDPQFTDAPGGDFSLKSGSECIDAGLTIELGIVEASKINQGAWQSLAASVLGGVIGKLLLLGVGA